MKTSYCLLASFLLLFPLFLHALCHVVEHAYQAKVDAVFYPLLPFLFDSNYSCLIGPAEAPQRASE